MTRPPVVTSLCGGLGNQMFQYAAGLSLALRLGAELKLNLAWYDSVAEVDTPRSFMLGAFPGICATVATRQECKRLMYARRGPLGFLLRRPRPHAASYALEPHYGYWDGFERLSAPVCLSGYWQNERYFVAYTDVIRRDFTFPELPSGEASDTARRILAAPHAVSVHVRRGDYASNAATAAFHGLCSLEYYTASLDVVAGRTGAAPDIFLFSDDPAWVRENFDTRGFPATIIDFPDHGDAPWRDMHLMSLCRHHILANSSFSWWGAWLSVQDGVVCCPERWFAPGAGMKGHPAPERWVRL